MLNYTEAIQESLKRKWIVGTCSQGEVCWCRTITCEEPLMYQEYKDIEPEEFSVVRQGDLGKEIVEHIVKLHNESLK